MQERKYEPLPEPEDVKDIVAVLAGELGLDLKKKPPFEEQYPQEQLFPEEAPSADGRHITGLCLEYVYKSIVSNMPPELLLQAPLTLTSRYMRYLHQELRRNAEQAWKASTNPTEPFPDFTLTHLLGATKRQMAHLTELKRFHESDVYDPALRVYNTIGFAIERAILDGDPDPQYMGWEL
jgi:hypothetical protein